MEALKQRVLRVLDLPPASLRISLSPGGRIATFRLFPRLPQADRKRQTAWLKSRAGELAREGWVERATAIYPSIYLEPEMEALSQLLEAELDELESLKRSPGYRGAVHLSYFSPNANKSLHLGHARNLAVGGAVANLLETVGWRVLRATVFSDYGIHIARAVAAYLLDPSAPTPAESGIKADHLVGRFYAEGSALGENGDESAAAFEARAGELLRAFIRGDRETRAIFERLTGWAISGFEESCRRFGARFDQRLLESETIGLWQDIVAKGLGNGSLDKAPDGSVWFPGTEKIERRIMARSDGSPLYILQRVACKILGCRESGSDLKQLISIRAHDQSSHFDSEISILQALGYSREVEHGIILHGLVYDGEDRLRSRRGQTLTLDQTLDELERTFARRLEARGLKTSLAAPLSVGTLRTFLLGHPLKKAIHFDWQQLVDGRGRSFWRLFELLRRARELAGSSAGGTRPAPDPRGRLLRRLWCFQQVAERCGQQRDPTRLMTYLQDLSEEGHAYLGGGGDLQGLASEARMLVRVLGAAFELLELPAVEELLA